MIDPPSENAPSALPPTPSEPPQQPPTQPSIEARPDLLPQAHPVPPNTVQMQPVPYGPYAPADMPVAPPPPASPFRYLLIVLVVVLIAGAGAAGYFLLGGDDEGGDAAFEAVTSGEETSSAAPEAEATTEEAPAFESSGAMIPVASVGSQTPVPSDTWELREGPGSEGADLNDMSIYVIQYEESWFANILIGTYNVADLPYDSAAMTEIATELTSFWSEQSAASGVNGIVSVPQITETTVDGRPAVLGEATASWDSTELSPDKSERVITFLVDVDGVNALYAQAWIPESADAEYDAVVAALLATTFA
ncbi:hypothetical protein [Glycomyces paridis]|uniref:Uncharacterized protein n=1 Tax=Glycomyces paridis TaxID=2126555 RepID=A0A4S8NUI8_9ACTN|nr:hypothetical protein [Glycomyces paridis]THV21237.1 hypothetical protein E9998_24835 [Glycomyces paridis]